MAYGGGGAQHIKLLKDQGSRPPVRVPDQPPGDGRLFWEQVLKWGGITIVGVILLVGFASMATCEREPTQRQLRATAQAESATEQAIKSIINPDDTR